MVELTNCLKAYQKDQDKVLAPAETVKRVRELLTSAAGEGLLAEARRIDTGRLGIPVYISRYGPRACEIVPTRKQMGKGASPEQAEASALMELVERFSFFSFFSDADNFEELTWSEAAERFGDSLIPVSQILRSVNEEITDEQAIKALDLVKWRFAPALDVAANKTVYVPADWFKLLNEYNGSSAGNRPEESVFQGTCEVVERHVSALIDKERPVLPTIEAAELDDSVLGRLISCFADNGVKVWLKDFTLGMPVPTVGALAYDPGTFPHSSEIVLTAGTASSPVKAAIRALTEVAQLAGDFHTGACYEPSGLHKPAELTDIDWLTDGEAVNLSSLPSVEREDIYEELTLTAEGLSKIGRTLYTIDITHPELGLAANYNFVPGFLFRERSPFASIGLFVGRRLSEEADLQTGTRSLKALEEIYPGGHFLPFFEGMLCLREGDPVMAGLKFERACEIQPSDEDTALCAFYAAYAHSQTGKWDESEAFLDRALALADDVAQYRNLRGVARFKRADYAAAAEDFKAAVKLDKGSAMDHANLGLCYKNLGRIDEAVHYLEAALEIDPDLEFARTQLSEIAPS